MNSPRGVSSREICSHYFENHISPVLRYIQQSQEQLGIQLGDLRANLAQKANRSEVPTLAQFEALATKGLQGSDCNGIVGVSMQVQLKELAAAVQRKADASNVATLAQMSKLSALVEQKAFAKDVPSAQQLADLTAVMEQKAVAEPAPAKTQLDELVKELEQKANLVDVATLEQVQALRTELLELCTEQAKRAPDRALVPIAEDGAGQPEAGGKSELKRVQVVVAAAGARFERQLREVKQQVRELREEVLGGRTPRDSDPRWPGRVLNSASAAQSDAGSVIESDAGSLAGSMAGSVMGLGPEEKAELKKIQAVVGAAGTAFARELRDLRGQVRTLHAELSRLKERLGPGSSGLPSPGGGSPAK